MPKRTPFYRIHEKADAKIIDFGGFDMPVQYESIKAEHHAVREKVGVFDVSHMGEFFVEGDGAGELIQYLTVNDVTRLSPGKAQYTCMCYEDGGIVDDLIVYMLAEGRYMLVVNASNIEKDLEWVTSHNDFDAEVTDRSGDYCLLAVQGPDSVKTLQKLTGTDLEDISFYSFETGNFAGFDGVILSATGYTGEKGFEIYFDAGETDPEVIWEAIMEAGEEYGIEPCGLGARDTLRLEMGFALYGNDIDKTTNPLEARLGWLTRLEAGDFIGRKALQRMKEEGLRRRLVGFVVDDPRSIPRKGYPILDAGGEIIGEVTSGSRSITLGTNIGMGYVSLDHASEGDTLYIGIRNRTAEATVQKPPFLNR
ncbi:MAG: glycine cleavage system aminomethyltransferase GcvT [Balneolaceae bacterium]|nr:glycine cleavage system aminomethyltransferase GcvT [Balneolaceae bacterium]